MNICLISESANFLVLKTRRQGIGVAGTVTVTSATRKEELKGTSPPVTRIGSYLNGMYMRR